MAIIQGGVRIGGKNPTSKAAIRRALGSGVPVTFYSTGFGGALFNGPLTELPAEHTLTVVGPDPYRDRKFYGTVTRTADGKIKVS